MNTWIEVESSTIDKVTYVADSDSNTMLVKFKSGSCYSYSNVPFELFDDFLNSESKGQFFNSFIKEEFEYENFGSGELRV